MQDEQQFADQQRAPIDQLVLMVDALLGLALVIAVLGIVNTLALSIIERTREIGLLRAIGLGRGQLRLMVTAGVRRDGGARGRARRRARASASASR